MDRTLRCVRCFVTIFITVLSIDVINVFTFFIQVTFFLFFNLFLFFPRFSFLKTLAKTKYEYAKIQRETPLDDASAMIFIDFGLLRSPY